MLTPTEKKLVELSMKYQGFSERMAVEQALLIMRGRPIYNVGLGPAPPDTDIMANGERIDLDEVEEALRAEAEDKAQNE